MFLFIVTPRAGNLLMHFSLFDKKKNKYLLLDFDSGTFFFQACDARAHDRL
jgi:hypothetical protein